MINIVRILERCYGKVSRKILILVRIPEYVLYSKHSRKMLKESKDSNKMFKKDV